MEIWKEIPNYEDYHISNLGKVKSLKYGKEKILKQGLDTHNYNTVSLSKNNIKKTLQVHQLLAMAFLNHIPDKWNLVVNHKDFIRTNNYDWNLEIVTQRENSNQKHLHSTSKYTGVHLNKKTNKWISSIHIKGELIYLGSFSNELEASEYYEKALKNFELGLEIEIKKHNFSSKHKGVYWCKSREKWFSTIKIDGKIKFLGYFTTELEAVNNRELAKEKGQSFFNKILL